MYRYDHIPGTGIYIYTNRIYIYVVYARARVYYSQGCITYTLSLTIVHIYYQVLSYTPLIYMYDRIHIYYIVVYTRS